jgi:hypothetical protein
MSKYIIKSKILSTLNEAIKKITLTEKDALVSMPKLDKDGSFISEVETDREPKVKGVEVQQDKTISRDEMVQKAKEKIKQSEDLIKDLDSIINQFSDKTSLTNKNNFWVVNEDHNDVYLQSKDAHIFQQNDSICLSHDGKIELFHTVDALHEWLKRNGWPLPEKIEIHESAKKSVLQEVAKSTVCKAWNYLVDFANGALQLSPDKKDFITPNGKKFAVTDIAYKELKQGNFNPEDPYIQQFKGKAKFTGKGSDYNVDADLETKVSDGNRNFNNSYTMQDWVRYHIKNSTVNSLDKRDAFTGKATTLPDAINNASNGIYPNNGQSLVLTYGNKKYQITKEDFMHDLDNLLGAAQKYRTRAALLDKILSNENVLLNPDFKEFIQKRFDYYNKTQEESTLDDKIHNLLESSKKYPWLNEIINQQLIKEDDTTTSDPLAGLDAQVADAGGMDIASSDSEQQSAETETDIDAEIMSDLDNMKPDFSGDLGSSGSGDINLNFDDNGEAQPQIPQQEVYDILDVVFPKKDVQDYGNTEILVKLQNKNDGSIIEKPLKDIDTL